MSTQVPKVYDAYRANGTLDWELDRQIAFHLTAVQFQMEQLYYGLALASALGRIIILPRVRVPENPTLKC